MKSSRAKLYVLAVGVVFGLVFQAQTAFGATVANSVITYAQTNLTSTSVTLNGAYSASTGTFTQVRFDYGTTPNVLSHTSYQSISNASGNFSDIISLIGGQTYYFRAMGIDSGGTPYFGTVLSFIAPIAQLPTAITYPATNLTSTGAILNGYFAANGSSTETYFQYANNSSFIGASETTHITQASSQGSISSPISATASTTYYFRAVAKSVAGTKYGTALSFTTPVGGGNPDPCTIGNFTANPSSISNGGITTLSWSTSNCTSVSINNGIGAVNLNGTYITSALFSNTTYIISASASGSSDTDQVTITVAGSGGNQCVIDYFYASPSSIDEGEDTNLYWGTTNCNDVWITSDRGNDPGSVSSDGSIDTDDLYEDTTFTLHASGNNNTVTRTENVDVGSSNSNDCRIDNFYANPSSVNYGQSTRLYWRTTRCDDVYITPLGYFNDDDGDAHTGAIYYTTRFFIRAYGDDGDEDTDELVVYVNGSQYPNPYPYPYSQPDPVPPNPPTQPPQIIYVNGGGSGSDTTTNNVSRSSMLSIEAQFGNVYIGDIMSYIVKYRNTGKNSLDNANIIVYLPAETEVVGSSTGLINPSARQVSISLGTLSPNESGSATVEVLVTDRVRKGDRLVARAMLTGTNRGTGSIDSVAAYADTRVMDGKDGNSLSAAAIFGEDVLPTTLGGWIILFALFGTIVYVGRTMYVSRKKKGVQHPHPTPFESARLH